jgi:hypothetical protein
VTDFLELWAPSSEMPDGEAADTPCTLIQIPLACPDCGCAIRIKARGSADEPGCIKIPSTCHPWQWGALIAARLHATPAAPPTPSGPPNCTKCGESNVYQSGPFVCWSCQQDPWR